MALAVLSAAPAALQAQSPAPAGSAPPGPSVSPVVSPTPDSLAELTSALLLDEEKRGKIDAELSAEAPLAAVSAKAAALNKEIGNRLAEDGKLLASGPSLEVVGNLEASWQDQSEALAVFRKSLTDRADRYDTRIKTLDELQKTWNQRANEAATPQELRKRMSALGKAARKNWEDVQKLRGELAYLLGPAQKQVLQVDEMIGRIKQARPQAMGRLFLTESVPIWSATLWSKTLWSDSGFNLGAETRVAWAKQCQAVGAYAQGMSATFLLHGFLFAVLLCVLFWARRRVRAWTGDDPSLSRAAQVFEAPVSMAIVFSLLAAQGIYPQAPPLLVALGGAAALIPAVLILRRLLDRHLFPVLNAMVVFYFLDQWRRVATALPIAARFLFLAEMAGGVAFAAWLLRSRRLGQLREQNPRLAKVTRAGGQVALAVFAAALLANAVGCVDLGNLLGDAALQSACLAVVLYAATRVANGLIAGGLSAQPLAGLRMVRHHRTLLWQRTHRLFDVAALLFWASETLNQRGFRSVVWEKLQSFLCKDGDYDHLTLLGQALAFGAVVWGAFLLSRFLRFVLEEDFYPRVRVERGLSYAVSTMLHYAVLLFGFYIAAALAGIDMTKFNILVGAFGVGMGFGLQNIINNFVSGVILLFERPVNVGDVVQMDSTSGTVDRIGIRASIIRTGNGSEIIVPNGKLISDQVINWTLSNRLRGIELPVSVAEGADPCRVIELLKTIAAAHPLVCAQPPPNALLTELGAADAMQFKLTAWTERFDQWGQIRSDLAVAVHAAFAREGFRRPAPTPASLPPA